MSILLFFNKILFFKYILILLIPLKSINKPIGILKINIVIGKSLEGFCVLPNIVPKKSVTNISTTGATITSNTPVKRRYF